MVSLVPKLRLGTRGTVGGDSVGDVIGPRPWVAVRDASYKLIGCNRRSARWRGGMEVDGGFDGRDRVAWFLFLFDGFGTPTIGH